MHTTLPAEPGQSWTNEDHWREGDAALWIYSTTTGVHQKPVTIVSPTEHTVCDPAVSYNGGVFTISGAYEQVRHRRSCPYCMSPVYDTHLTGERDRPATDGTKGYR